jgi:glycosyltransferase involved in cell wall biosynthesis
MNKKGNKIAIFCRNAIDAIDGNYPGGAEKQLILISKGLKDRGYHVSLIDVFHNKESINYKGFYIVAPWEKNKGINGIRFLYYQLPSLWKTMRKINVDYYYIRGEGLLYSFIALFCRFQKVKYIWGLAGDWEADPALRKHRKKKRNFVGTLSKVYLANFSNKIQRKYCSIAICQNNYQKENLGDTVGKSLIIKNIIESGNPVDLQNNVNRTIDFLWVAQISGIKGEAYLLELARRLPECSFYVLGKVHKNFEASGLYQDMINQKNLKLVGHVSNKEVIDLLDKSKFYLHTSATEGVSNSILEAMSRGVVVISMFYDADNVFSKSKAGLLANDNIDKAVELISTYSEDNGMRKEIGESAINYVSVNHSREKIIDEYIGVLNRIKSECK